MSRIFVFPPDNLKDNFLELQKFFSLQNQDFYYNLSPWLKKQNLFYSFSTVLNFVYQFQSIIKYPIYRRKYEDFY